MDAIFTSSWRCDERGPVAGGWSPPPAGAWRASCSARVTLRASRSSSASSPSGKGTTPRRAFGYALLFALGILISIAAVGGLTAAAGRMLGDVGPANYAVAVVLLLVGLHLLNILPLPWERGSRCHVSKAGPPHCCSD